VGRDKEEQRCSFCAKARSEVANLVAGPRGVYICDECVGLSEQLRAADRALDPGPGAANTVAGDRDPTSALLAAAEHVQVSMVGLAAKIDALAGQVEAQTALIEALRAEVAALRREAG
jgi:hypothetical protein